MPIYSAPPSASAAAPSVTGLRIRVGTLEQALAALVDGGLVRSADVVDGVLTIRYVDGTEGLFELTPAAALTLLSEDDDTATVSFDPAWIVSETATTITLAVPDGLITDEDPDTLTLPLTAA